MQNNDNFDVKKANDGLESFIKGFKSFPCQDADYVFEEYCYKKPGKLKSGTVSIVNNCYYIDWLEIFKVYKEIISRSKNEDNSSLIEENIDFIKKFYEFTSRHLKKIFGAPYTICENENLPFGDSINRFNNFTEFATLKLILDKSAIIEL